MTGERDMMKDKLLSVKNLEGWYHREKPVLKDFSLELDAHEAVGLIGLNGAGKTTFFKILSGLLRSFRAEGIRFKGQDAVLTSREFKLHRYTVFAEDDSFRYFTFREYLSYVFSSYKKEIPDLTGLIEGFRFGDYTDILLRDLSTGNKKKAFLITAFALRPELLLLDEPVNGLDFTSTEFLYRLISGYKEYGTVLFSSHILESITLTADRVLVLEQGRLLRSFEGEEISAERIREVLGDEEHL